MQLTGKAETVEIDQIVIRALELRFPGRNVNDELCKMHLWLLRYPTRRPVKIWRFVDAWLKRAHSNVVPLRAARVNNLNALCGRTDAPNSVDGEIVRPISGYLRKQDG